MDYEPLRQFADSWGLAAMAAVFVFVVIYTLRPGSRAKHDDAAQAPFRHDDGPDAATDTEANRHG